jgi:hypothetical protein
LGFVLLFLVVSFFVGFVFSGFVLLFLVVLFCCVIVSLYHCFIIWRREQLHLHCSWAPWWHAWQLMPTPTLLHWHGRQQLPSWHS